MCVQAGEQLLEKQSQKHSLWNLFFCDHYTHAHTLFNFFLSVLFFSFR